MGAEGFRFSQTMGFALAARAYFLLLRQKKVAKEKATPGSVPAPRVPCATRNAGRLAKLACGSNNASRLPPAFLRCSAPLKGAPKASRLDLQPEKWPVAVDDQKGAKIKSALALIVALPISARAVFLGPLRGAEQRRLERKKGEHCLRGFSPELRSPRPSRVAQGTGAAGTDPGSPFLCLLSFGEAKESETRRKRGTPSQLAARWPSQGKALHA